MRFAPARVRAYSGRHARRREAEALAADMLRHGAGVNDEDLRVQLPLVLHDRTTGVARRVDLDPAGLVAAVDGDLDRFIVEVQFGDARGSVHGG